MISGPSFGKLDGDTVNKDGSFSYMPDGIPVDDEFVYEIDCNGLTSQATVKLPAPPRELSHGVVCAALTDCFSPRADSVVHVSRYVGRQMAPL